MTGSSKGAGDYTETFGGYADNGGRPGGDDVTRREKKVRAQFWEKLRRVAANIPFTQELVAAYYCALDPETPTRVRGLLLGALAYFILPTDAIPDFLPGLGFTDDAAVLAAVVGMISQHMKPKHREAAARKLGAEPPDIDAAGGEDDRGTRA